MLPSQTPLSWPAIILILVAAAVATGLSIGALGYVVALPRWLPSAALGGVVGVLGAFLISRRNAQIAAAGRG